MALYTPLNNPSESSRCGHDMNSALCVGGILLILGGIVCAIVVPLCYDGCPKDCQTLQTEAQRNVDCVFVCLDGFGNHCFLTYHKCGSDIPPVPTPNTLTCSQQNLTLVNQCSIPKCGLTFTAEAHDSIMAWVNL